MPDLMEKVKFAAKAPPGSGWQEEAREFAREIQRLHRLIEGIRECLSKYRGWVPADGEWDDFDALTEEQNELLAAVHATLRVVDNGFTNRGEDKD